MSQQNNITDYLSHLTQQAEHTGVSLSVLLNSRKIVIFHHSDVDGAFAAAALVAAFSEPMESDANSNGLKVIPVNYGSYDEDEILSIVDKDTDVFVVDFAFPVNLSDALNEKASYFLTIDHHKTNQQMLEGKPYAIFDMQSSGAKMAYLWVRPSAEKIPLAVTLADNRDLWQKTDGREDSFHEAIMEFRSSIYQNSKEDADIKFINGLTMFLHSDQATQAACLKGDAMLLKRDSNIQSVCQDKNLYETVIGGYPAVVVNYPIDQSDACQFLYSQEKYKDKIAATISFKQGKALFSLRKNAGLDLDLGKIAEVHYGGGGHAAAAGFAVDMQRGVNILQNKEKWALCWPTDAVQAAIENGATDPSECARQLASIPAALHSRATCETDESLQQILPYLVLVNEDDEVLVYRRPSKGTEARLHHKYSIGLGGHVDTVPQNHTLGFHLGEEGGRELIEEVGISLNTAIRLHGDIEQKFTNGDFITLRLKTGPVERVHMGLAFILKVKKSEVDLLANPDEVQDATWVNKEALTRFFGSGGDDGHYPAGVFEAWSDYLINVSPSAFA